MLHRCCTEGCTKTARAISRGEQRQTLLNTRVQLAICCEVRVHIGIRTPPAPHLGPATTLIPGLLSFLLKTVLADEREQKDEQNDDQHDEQHDEDNDGQHDENSMMSSMMDSMMNSMMSSMMNIMMYSMVRTS